LSYLAHAARANGGKDFIMTDSRSDFRHRKGAQILALFRFFGKDYLKRSHFKNGKYSGRIKRSQKRIAFENFPQFCLFQKGSDPL
jgi:hypothetical protein